MTKTLTLPLCGQESRVQPVEYVAGFMFDNLRKRVVLIRKDKPEWQRGKLNGVGGKIEDNEGPEIAMVREFYEETGVSTWSEEWQYFCLLQRGEGVKAAPWKVHFFACIGDPNFIRHIEETGGAEREKVEIVAVDDIHRGQVGIIKNLSWLVPLALDFIGDLHPGFVTATYSR